VFSQPYPFSLLEFCLPLLIFGLREPLAAAAMVPTAVDGGCVAPGSVCAALLLLPYAALFVFALVFRLWPWPSLLPAGPLLAVTVVPLG
jgi:hypothetical protein